jgi:hypothetical protein
MVQSAYRRPQARGVFFIVPNHLLMLMQMGGGGGIVMLIRSQPIDPKFYKKLKLSDLDELEERSEPAIKSQRIGKMFDDLIDGDRKISLWKCLKWKKLRVRGKYYDMKHAVRNHIKWHKTLCEIRSWEGFDGLLKVMQTHLQDYIDTEEKYGIAHEDYKRYKIATAQETLELLSRMCEPDEYSFRRRREVDARYPQYASLISEYEDGGGSSSGDFVPQGDGWAGMESGKDPREGYFEFVDGRFELVESPDGAETNRLLSELKMYHEEVSKAYEQAEEDSDLDFECLGKLLKENLYSWWD